MMQRAYIIGDTGKAMVISLISGDEEIFRKDFPYEEGKNKPSIIECVRTSGDALLRNTEFFTRT